MNYLTFKDWFDGRKMAVIAIAKELDVDRKTIYKWINGDPIAPRNARRISLITGIPVENLIFGDQDIKKEAVQ